MVEKEKSGDQRFQEFLDFRKKVGKNDPTPKEIDSIILKKMLNSFLNFIFIFFNQVIWKASGILVFKYRTFFYILLTRTTRPIFLKVYKETMLAGTKM